MNDNDTENTGLSIFKGVHSWVLILKYYMNDNDTEYFTTQLCTPSKILKPVFSTGFF